MTPKASSSASPDSPRATTSRCRLLRSARREGPSFGRPFAMRGPAPRPGSWRRAGSRSRRASVVEMRGPSLTMRRKSSPGIRKSLGVAPSRSRSRSEADARAGRSRRSSRPTPSRRHDARGAVVRDGHLDVAARPRRTGRRARRLAGSRRVPADADSSVTRRPPAPRAAPRWRALEDAEPLEQRDPRRELGGAGGGAGVDVAGPSEASRP